MMTRWIMCAALFIFAACSSKNSDEISQVKGQHKPLVAIVPMIDSTKAPVDWDLSKELTTGICHRIEQRDKIELAQHEKVGSLVKKLKKTNHPFSHDTSWVKSAFPGLDFVVFLELIEHEEIPTISPTSERSAEKASAQLNMSMRLRVFDLRKEQPQVVLQELVHESHSIPKPFNQYNFHQVAWGDMSYPISPMGLAHAALIKEISLRLEDYILFASHG